MTPVLIFLTFCGTISFCVLLVGLLLLRWKLRSKGIVRAFFLTLIWWGCAGGFYYALHHSAGFNAGIPSGMLRLDLRYPLLGRIAIAELRRRTRNEQEQSVAIAKTTDVLLDHPWWITGPMGSEPTTINKSVRVDSAANGWLGDRVAACEMTHTDMARWIELDTPPFFTLANASDESDEQMVRLQWGREWTRFYDIPYEIDQVHIERITIDSIDVSWSSRILSDDQTPDLGRYATWIELELGNYRDKRNGDVIQLPLIDTPESTNTTCVTIEYRLDIEPGNLKSIGPFVWQNTCNK